MLESEAMMQIGLAPGTGFRVAERADFVRYADALSAAGFDAISVGSDQLTPFVDGAGGTPDGLAGARSILDDHGLICTDVLALTVRRQERDELDQARQLITAATALGAPNMLTLCFTDPTEPVMERLDRIAELASASGVTLTLEFCPGLAVHSLPTGVALCDAIGRDRMGLTLDAWHFFRGGSTWQDLEDVPLECVRVVQFDDAPPMAGGDIMTETYRRTWPGLGEFDLDRLASTLTGRGWDGVVSVEVLSDETRLLSPEEFADRAFSSTRPYWTAA
jgi:sugar phosphate isomerase/epimerase